MRWPGYKHVFFDCDSTLTTVEGIDLLAETDEKKRRIEGLTRAAMDGSLDLEEIYGERLQVVQPTRRQIQEIRRIYKRNVVEDAHPVIAALQALGHQVYIISGGLAEPVEEFGVFLGVPRRNIRAVDIKYDQLAGVWWEGRNQYKSTDSQRYLSYEDGALTVSDGKGKIVRELLGDQSGRSLLIGDGMSDLLASQAVDFFVGYGGVIKREQVLAKAPVFMHSKSLAPLLALVAGPAALRRLRETPHETVVSKSLDLLRKGAISFKDERLQTKFSKALRAAIDASD